MSTAVKPRITKTQRARSAFWSHLAKVASKEARRDLLEGGVTYDVSATISASIGKLPYQQQIRGALKVAHDHERASSTTPDQVQFTALLLSLIRPGERARLVRELPEIYAQNDNRLPEVDPQYSAMATDLLGRLRSKVMQTVRGTVAAEYVLLLPE